MYHLQDTLMGLVDEVFEHRAVEELRRVQPYNMLASRRLSVCNL